MEKVDNLVERARYLSLHPLQDSYPIDAFHAVMDAHLKRIYETIVASDASRAEFQKTVQADAGSGTGTNTGTAGIGTSDPLVSVDAFRAYMKDGVSRALAPAPDLDCSAPISDYFVSSSHNTYLTGNQLSSDAAASAYTSVSTHNNYTDC